MNKQDSKTTNTKTLSHRYPNKREFVLPTVTKVLAHRRSSDCLGFSVLLLGLYLTIFSTLRQLLLYLALYKFSLELHKFSGVFHSTHYTCMMDVNKTYSPVLDSCQIPLHFICDCCTFSDYILETSQCEVKGTAVTGICWQIVRQ